MNNIFYSETSRESELPRECGRGPNRELSMNRLYDVYEVESSSSSESEVEIAASGSGAASLGPVFRSGTSAYREHMARPVSAVRAFRDWRISCSGSSSGETEEFLRRLQEMQKCTRLSDREILDAVPSVLAVRALQWYRSLGSESLALRDFIAQLREQFVRRMDREDLYEELRARTQVPGECACDFLASVRCIVARFDCSPSAAKQLRIVLRNLHPEFRHFLESKDVRELEDIRRFGLEFERALYTPTGDK